MGDIRKIRVMISSRSTTTVFTQRSRLSDVRLRLQAFLHGMRWYHEPLETAWMRQPASRVGRDQSLFDVWIHENDPGKASDKSTLDISLDEISRADIVIALYTGEAGSAAADAQIGICHAELQEALARRPEIVSLVGLLPLQESQATRDRAFRTFVTGQSLYRKDVDNEADLQHVVAELLQERVAALVARGATAGRRKRDRGQALDWNRLDLAARQIEMRKSLARHLHARPVGPDRGSDTLHVATLPGEQPMAMRLDAIAAATSMAAARERVGQPFLRDHLYAPVLQLENLPGVLHVIACNRSISEVQATRTLGTPDAISVVSDFGAYVADHVQRTQLAFLAHCADDTATALVVRRFNEWLAQSGESARLIERAWSRRRILEAMAAEQSAATTSRDPRSVEQPRRTMGGASASAVAGDDVTTVVAEPTGRRKPPRGREHRKLVKPTPPPVPASPISAESAAPPIPNSLGLPTRTELAAVPERVANQAGRPTGEYDLPSLALLDAPKARERVANRGLIRLRELFESEAYRHSRSPLPLALGKTTSGEPLVVDLAALPHLLIAGSTGAGESVSVNAMLSSLLFRATPDELRLILIDSKRHELGLYEDIPHLLTPVVVEPKNATNALRWAVREMEERFKTLSEAGVQNIEQYNRKLKLAQTANFGAVCDRRGIVVTPLPFIVLAIDELAELMMTDRNRAEESIVRLAQMARAVGIHLILATRRPSVDVITGLIKANLPARIAFQVASRADSHTILDGDGAEQLLGKGDLLFLPPAPARVVRLQGPSISGHERGRLTKFLRTQGRPAYNPTIVAEEKLDDRRFEHDDLYDEAARIVVASGQPSVSYLQRRLRIGFGRAARLVDRMEAEGIVSPSVGGRAREVLMNDLFKS